jgi:hypothetical protein
MSSPFAKNKIAKGRAPAREKSKVKSHTRETDVMGPRLRLEDLAPSKEVLALAKEYTPFETTVGWHGGCGRQIAS